MLANLIEKYAAVLDIDNLPEPPVYDAKASVGTCQWHVLKVEAKNNKGYETERRILRIHALMIRKVSDIIVRENSVQTKCDFPDVRKIV